MSVIGESQLGIIPSFGNFLPQVSKGVGVSRQFVEGFEQYHE